MRLVGRSLDVGRNARRAELVVDLARPDGDWWFSFATDIAPDLVAALLEHPDAYRVPAIERGLLPRDQATAQILRSCMERDSRLRLTDDACHALTELARGPASRPERPMEPSGRDVELRRDRGGRNWILIGSEHAPLARALGERTRASVARRSCWVGAAGRGPGERCPVC